MRRSLLVLPLIICLFGCADRPTGQAIVLRSHHPERYAVHRVAAPRSGVRSAVQATPVPLGPECTPNATAAAELRPEPAPQGAAAELSSDQKEALFRGFDDYLQRSGRKDTDGSLARRTLKTSGPLLDGELGELAREVLAGA